MFSGEQLYVEKCSLDTFSASCRDDALIVVTSSVIGRLRVTGSCISHDFGFLGLNTSVLPEVIALLSFTL